MKIIEDAKTADATKNPAMPVALKTTKFLTIFSLVCLCMK